MKRLSFRPHGKREDQRQYARPGMTFGMWGTWRTPGQTWWKDGAEPLFSYFARCQSLLQRGRFVDDFNGKNPSLSADAAGIQWIHRSDNGADIYFIANATDDDLSPTLTIEGTGRTPEVWDPETGETSIAKTWKTTGGKTKVWLNLTTRRAYFSGTARYSQHLYLKELNRNNAYVLDLGEVKHLAVVKVNGKVCGTLWHPPFTIDVTDALLGGDNTLEIDVTNLWVNRMVGDEQEPDDIEWSEPVTFGGASRSPLIGRFMKAVPEWLSKGQPRPTKRQAVVSMKFFEQATPLLRSGLIGPVAL